MMCDKPIRPAQQKVVCAHWLTKRRLRLPKYFCQAATPARCRPAAANSNKCSSPSFPLRPLQQQLRPPFESSIFQRAIQADLAFVHSHYHSIYFSVPHTRQNAFRSLVSLPVSAPPKLYSPALGSLNQGHRYHHHALCILPLSLNESSS